MPTKPKQRGPVYDVCDMLIKKIGEPTRLETCKAINVYDNRYRVNFYCRKYDKEHDIDRIRIEHSYFVIVDGDELIIKA